MKKVFGRTLRAIAAGKADEVTDLMTQHLAHVRAELNLDEAGAEVTGLYGAPGFAAPENAAS